MPGLRFSKALVGVKEEAAFGTFLAPDASTSFPAFDISIAYGESNYARRETNSHFGKRPELPGKQSCTIGFSILLCAPETNGAEPYYGEVMRGCSYQGTYAVATPLTTFKPWSTFDGVETAGPPIVENPHISTSVQVWVDGQAYRLRGGAGNAVLEFSAGEPVVMRYSFQGAFETVVDDIAVPTLATITKQPIRFLSANAQLTPFGGSATSVLIASMTLDTGNTLTMVGNANSSAGCAGYRISDRNPTLKISMEMEDVDTLDLLNDWTLGKSYAYSQGDVGSANNKFDIVIPSMIIRPPSLGDNAGIQTVDVDFQIANTGAEGNDYSITTGMA